ncbi:MAG TPA: 3-oxoacid CoA-transferase subunit A [Solirubrobacterales bacterium]|nr:3-oxoacid CoA-transferase subunit A [Solirubrobacterales bacterium]
MSAGAETIDKTVAGVAAALGEVADGATIMVGGFGDSGIPEELLAELLEQGARELTLIANNAGSGESGVAALLRERRVRKIVCSFPRSSGSVWFERRYRAGEVELEIVPQGTLSERIRAGGAGIAAFYTPTAAGTELAAGKETRLLDGREHLLEHALRADLALIRARAADRWGNLVYHTAARNYAPTMAMAARETVAQVDELVGLGDLDPEAVVTPGVYVDRVVRLRREEAR